MPSRELNELSSALQSHIQSDGLLETAVRELKLFRASTPTEEETVVYDPCLCVVVQGAKEIVVGEKTYHYNPSQSLLVSVDMPATTRVAEASQESPCVALVVRLQSNVVADLLAEGTVVGSPGPPGNGVGVTPAQPKLLRALCRLVELLDSPEEIDAIAPLILREITYRLLTGPQGDRLRQIATPGAPTQRIADAISWLKEHYAESMKVETLADHVGLSTSAFYQHFKSVTSLSPIQYQKRFRLQEARRLMLSDGLGAAEAAFAVGYESPSQFGREYRRLFGATPTQSVAALAHAQ